MEIIGKKKIGILFLYIIVGMIIMSIGIAAMLWHLVLNPKEDLIAGIFGAIFALCGIGSLCLGIYILIIPKNLIAVKGTTVIFLKNNKEIEFTDILSILSVRATGGKGRRIEYAFGTIIITTNDGKKHKQNFIADVEKAANILNGMVKSVIYGQ